MKIKVTASNLTMMSEALTDLLNTKMPVGVGYHVARLMQKLEPEIQLVLTRQAELMKKYNAEATEEGALKLTKDNPKFAKAKDELNDLLAQVITLEADVVTLPKNVALKPGTLLVLGKFIKVAGT